MGLTTEGKESILEAFFRRTTDYIPTQFYIRLCNDTLTASDTLTSILNEPSGNGYSAQLVEASSVGFPTKDTFEGNPRLTSKEVTFTAASGDIGPVNTVFIATTSDNSGKLIGYLDLPISRTILDGDSMVISVEVIE